MKLIKEREREEKNAQDVKLNNFQFNKFLMLKLKPHMKIVVGMNKLFRTTVSNYHANKLSN